MTASSRPASPAARRITSLSKALSRQPNVMISSPGHRPAAAARIEAAVEGESPPARSSARARSSRQSMSSSPPSSTTVARAAVRPRRCRRDERGAGAAAAGARDADAALPDAQADPLAARRTVGDADIGALGKQLGSCSSTGAERREIDRLGVGDEERRVRVADIGADRVRRAARREIGTCSVSDGRAPAGCRASRVRAAPMSTATRHRPAARRRAARPPSRQPTRSPARSPRRAATRRSACRCRRPRPRCRRR